VGAAWAAVVHGDRHWTHEGVDSTCSVGHPGLIEQQGWFLGQPQEDHWYQCRLQACQFQIFDWFVVTMQLGKFSVEVSKLSVEIIKLSAIMKLVVEIITLSEHCGDDGRVLFF